ncbi:APR-like 4 [Tasmannia lanceolata]|uniref:APR-like 4 n=1 Tax=Tasmannia lanceolata TaxID=3420 RepID=UPI0040630BF5
MSNRFCQWAFVLSLALIQILPLESVRVRVPSSSVCPASTAAESILRFRDSCSISELQSHRGDLVGVTEGDDVSLQQALNFVHKNSHDHASILFYASWCPFSKDCRPNFTFLSFLFPKIRHFAIEESSIRPSILSRYGVHGFPTLFLMNSTTRVRYHGSRTLDSLVLFYNQVTGMKPEALNLTTFEKIMEQLNTKKPEDTNQEEFCPFSWARSPEKLLRQETYLALATTFVLLRFVHFLLPTLLTLAKRAWRRHMRSASLLRLWEHPQVYLEQVKEVFRGLKPCKRSNLQEGAMNAKVWASKSLASVSIGEAGSSRLCLGSERR